MQFKWTLIGVIVVLAMMVGVVAYKLSKKNQECYDAGGLIVQTHNGWRCVEAK